MGDAPLTVVLCADRKIEIGLHVTLHSLIAHASTNLKIYLFHDGFDTPALDRIGQTLADLENKFTLTPIAFRDEMFASLPAIDGSRYTYVRLLLADYVAEPRFIYLDSDLVVLLDVAELFAQPLDEHVIGVSGMGTVEWQVDKSFFQARGIPDTAPYFNAGVLLIDADRWRRHSSTQMCLAIAAAHGPLLRCYDQTILNFHFQNQTKVLAPRFNALLFPRGASVGTSPPPAIYHFLGRPKPWDFLAEFTNPNHALFQATLSQTCFADYRSYHRFGLNEARAAARSSRDFLRSAKDRLRKVWRM